MKTPETHTPRRSIGEGQLPPALRSFELWTVLLFALSVLFHLVEHLRGLPPFLGSPFSPKEDRFGDFRIFVYKFEFFHTAKFFHVGFPINYPAPAAVFIEFFIYYFPHPVRAFLVFCILTFAVAAVLLARALYRRGVALSRASFFVISLSLFSWPAVLLIDRGNVEILVFVSLAAALWCYATGRAWLAAGLFGVAASIKLFPFVLLGLYASRRQWGKVLFAAAVFLLMSVLSFAILGPTISVAYHGLAVGLASFKANYMALWRSQEAGVDHSLFNVYKWLSVTFFHHSENFTQALGVYLIATAVFGVLLYIFRIRFLPLLNQILLLTIASIYFTAFSGDGTLIHLYAPLVMLLFLAIAADRKGIVVPGLRLTLNCLVYLLSFETFLVYHNQRFIGVSKSVALGVLFIAGLIYPMGPPLDQTRSELILSEPELWIGRDALDSAGPASASLG